MKNEIKQYEEHSAWRSGGYPHIDGEKSPKMVNRNFNAQIPVSDNLYKIPLQSANATSASKQLVDKNDGVGGKVGGGGVKYVNRHDGIINSVENFQLMPKPLAPSKSSTPSSALNLKTSEASDAKFNVPNAPIPDQVKASSTTAASRKVDENSGKKSRQVPAGVVPIPQNNFDEVMVKNVDNTLMNPEEAENNRYVNVVDEAGGGKKTDSEGEKGQLIDMQGDDNAAHEVMDNNDFVVEDRNHKDHSLNHADVPLDKVNNAAEEDMNLYDNHKFPLVKQMPDADDDLEVIQKSDDKKRRDEVDADQGKVAYPDEMHLEENLEEEDGR